MAWFAIDKPKRGTSQWVFCRPYDMPTMHPLNASSNLFLLAERSSPKFAWFLYWTPRLGHWFEGDKVLKPYVWHYISWATPQWCDYKKWDPPSLMSILGIPNLEKMLVLIKSATTLESLVRVALLPPISRHNQPQAKYKWNHMKKENDPWNQCPKHQKFRH